MKLYHGTSGVFLDIILEQGLLPRADSGYPNTWGDYPSHPDCVYLSTAYAPYFAAVKATQVSKAMRQGGDSTLRQVEEARRWCIIEVELEDLDEDDMRPDEDYLTQGLHLGHRFNDDAGRPIPKSLRRANLEKKTTWLRERLHSFSRQWFSSLEGLGNVAHCGVIPPSKISGVVTFDESLNPWVGAQCWDPCISTLNYSFMGDTFRHLSSWFFADVPEEQERVINFFTSGTSSAPALMSQLTRDQLTDALSNRGGVQRHHPRPPSTTHSREAS